MTKATLAAVLIVLCGSLAACGPKPEPAAPVDAVQATPAPDAMPAPDATPAPDAMPAPDDGMEGDDSDGEIAPHAGGDKVNKTPEQEQAADAGG